MTDTTLLPCPFCGSAAKLLRVDRGGRLADDSHAVTCSNDGCVVGPISDCDTEAEAITAWNRRDQWRPKSEWRFKGENGRFVFYYPKQRAEWFDGGQLGPMYEHGCEPPERAMDWTLFMEITPPAPVSGGNK